MAIKFVFLWTDILIFLLFFIAVAFAVYSSQFEHLRAPWRQVARRPLAMAAMVILSAYVFIGLLDSVHFRERLPDQNQYSPEVLSLLDKIVTPLRTRVEKTYSAPFAVHGFTKETVEYADGRIAREYPRLLYGGAHLKDPRDRAADMSRDAKVEVRILSFAEGRSKRGFMPQANLPAAGRALEMAGVTVADLAAVKTHNPFAVNEICLSNGLGIPLEKMNNYGCSLIWGHPQGPTGMRLVIELIEELVRLGGGYGLFTGCAAGDTAGALVLRVSEAN
jgi:hypothetical protein